jgi:L-threonylcarbamoyladenylate synthase
MEMNQAEADSTTRLPTRIMRAGDPDTIRTAVRILRDGGVLAVPTDTVYGLVGLFDQEKAIGRILEIKGRGPNKPLPILLGATVELPLVAAEIPEIIWPLVYRYWPGPLTVVFRAKDSVSRRITAGLGTVGARVPASPDVLDILEAASLPFVSSSANRAGDPPATTVDEIAATIGSEVDLIIAPREAHAGGTASTVLDLTTTAVLVRRRGSIPVSQIREALQVRIAIFPDA